MWPIVSNEDGTSLTSAGNTALKTCSAVQCSYPKINSYVVSSPPWFSAKFRSGSSKALSGFCGWRRRIFFVVPLEAGTMFLMRGWFRRQWLRFFKKSEHFFASIRRAGRLITVLNSSLFKIFIPFTVFGGLKRVEFSIFHAKPSWAFSGFSLQAWRRYVSVM